MNIKDYVTLRKKELKMAIQEMGKKPSLAIINTLKSPATDSYIRGKVKDAEEIGINAEVFYFEESLTIEEFQKQIKELPHDAIILQLPLHPNYAPHKNKLLNTIPYYKDVDGLGAFADFKPCTPSGIMSFLLENKVPIIGQNVVIIGRSDLVGKPLARLMLDQNATVTLCHSYTKDLAQYTLNADIIVCAIGKPGMLTADHVRYDGSQIVIDVGINRVNGKLCGDVSPEVKDCVKYLSPVPGGVGLLTRLALMENTFMAAMGRKE